MKNFKSAMDHVKIIPYIMIGQKGLEFSMKQYDYYISKGCKIIELGIPFSDPSADGPSIQSASKNALDHSTTIDDCIDFLKTCKAKTPEVILIVMTYLNPIYSYGLSKFFNHEFIDGVIIPDLPFEEYPLIKKCLMASSMALIPLVALDTSKERFKKITSMGSGFIYLMSVKGITGSKNVQEEKVFNQIKALKPLTTLPIVTGFGIKTKVQGQGLLKHADGIIMASQLIKHWQKDDIESLDAIFVD